MGDFLRRHSYIVVWISALIITGAIAILILQLNSIVLTPPAPPSVPLPANQTQPSPETPQASAIPPAPMVSLTIEKSPTGNSFVVQWQNLPDGTVALNIYRGKTGTDQSTWALWKTLSLSGKDLSSGSASINIGKADGSGYSFYTEAIQGGGPSNGTSTPAWISPPIIPIVTTSTPLQSPSNPTPSSTPPTPSSTNQNTPPSPTSTPQNNSSTPTGTPYYNPQIQISAYGSGQSGNFWVQPLDQKIQIGWQDIPAQATSIVVVRSTNQNGPWSQLLSQQNPGTSGSIQVVDNTVGQPNYYEMNAIAGTSTIATYGPVYLSGN